VASILFWGALWGLEEATLGHFLHMLPLNIGWVFYFPLAYSFMSAAYRKAGKAGAVLYTSLIAAAIKLLDLFITVQIPKVIHPAAAILLEGLAVFAVFRILEKKPRLNRLLLGRALAVSISQALLFMGFITVTPLVSPVFKPVSGLWAYAEHLYHAVIDALIIFVFLKYAKPYAEKIKAKLTPVADALRQNKTAGLALKAAPYLMLVFAIYISLVV